MKRLPLLFCILLFFTSSWLSQSAAATISQLGLSYDKFSGPELTSFGERTQGFGVLVGGIKKNSFIGILTGIQANYITGQQYFMDGTTKKLITYSGYGASVYLGTMVVPLPSVNLLDPYVVAGGSLGITFLENKTAGLTKIPSSQSRQSAGYFLGFGVAHFDKNSSKSDWSPYFELRFEYESGTFFEVSGFQKNKVAVILGVNY